MLKCHKNPQEHPLVMAQQRDTVQDAQKRVSIQFHFATGEHNGHLERNHVKAAGSPISYLLILTFGQDLYTFTR